MNKANPANPANPANKPQEAADHMKPSSGSVHGSLHIEKQDIPEYGKKVSNVALPSHGGENHAGKDSSNPCDAKGNPGRYSRTVPGHATEKTGAVKTARDKQNGSNGMQGN